MGLKLILKYTLLPILFLLGLYSHAQSVEVKQWIVNGNNYYLNKDFDKARAEYIKALSKTPNNIKANFNLGNALYELKDYQKAATHYERVAKATSDKLEKANAYHNMGNSFMQQQSYDKAVDAYKNSLRNNPKDNETRYNYALAKKLLNKKQQNKQNPPDLPKPSEFAKQQKAKADALASEAKFQKALDVMHQALNKDSTVMHFSNFIDKLNQVVMLDTIKLK